MNYCNIQVLNKLDHGEVHLHSALEWLVMGTISILLHFYFKNSLKMLISGMNPDQRNKEIKKFIFIEWQYSYIVLYHK